MITQTRKRFVHRPAGSVRRVTSRTGWGYTSDKLRLHLSRHLRGDGIELGPGHHPYVTVLPGTHVKYVDRWEQDENRALFPELGEAAEFPKPDVVANLDEQLLEMFETKSQDFIITSHLFEHVGNPLALLEDCHRVLRPGAVLILLLPDMTRTSDARRTPTTLQHLVSDYDAKARGVDDEHVVDYLRVVRSFEGTGDELAERIAYERTRSFHVHCWVEETFFPVLEYAATHLDSPFEMVDLVLTPDIPGGKEFGYVLRRPLVEASAIDHHERLVATRELLLKTRFAQSDPARAAAGPQAPKPKRPFLVRAARKAQREVRARIKR
jgi:predicted SAM-dependent methyltransferase